MTVGRPIATGDILETDEQRMAYALMSTPPMGSDRPAPRRRLIEDEPCSAK